MLLKFISPRNESGCEVEYDDDNFRKRDEGIPEMFVILLGRVRDCRNRKYFSNDKQKGDYQEDVISISDP